MKKAKIKKEQDTEQYIKDVRSLNVDEGGLVDNDDLDQTKRNQANQESNKKAQKNAETEAKFGDSSEPEKSIKRRK